MTSKEPPRCYNLTRHSIHGVIDIAQAKLIPIVMCAGVSYLNSVRFSQKGIGSCTLFIAA